MLYYQDHKCYHSETANPIHVVVEAVIVAYYSSLLLLVLVVLQKALPLGWPGQKIKVTTKIGAMHICNRLALAEGQGDKKLGAMHIPPSHDHSK